MNAFIGLFTCPPVVVVAAAAAADDDDILIGRADKAI